jgi:hypothetical protein
MFGKHHESIACKMKFGSLLLADKQRIALATGATSIMPPKSTHGGNDASVTAGAEPIDFPKIIISDIWCFNFDNVKSSMAEAELFIPSSEGSPVLKP